MRKTIGLTLIELLVVVGIVGILAAVAVPNLLEAHVRSKSARAKADLRTLAAALEAYLTEFNRYPPTTYNLTNGYWPIEVQWKVYPGALTTPIAFLSAQSCTKDVFRVNRFSPNELAREPMYLPTAFYQLPYTIDTGGHAIQSARFGEWVLRSAGPDSFYMNQPGSNADYEGGGWNKASYDPTNGTASAGDIYRSQKNPSETHE